MAFNQVENITIFGMRGSGKSTLARKCQEYFPVKFIFDTLEEYSESDGIIVNDFNSFYDVVLKTIDKKVLTVIIQLDINTAENQDYFNNFMEVLYYRENCTIVLEEVQNYCTVHKIPKFLKQISLTGRHKNINFITTTQRIAEIHKSLLSQAHHLFSGYTDSPNDKKTLKEYGFNISDIENLEKYIFLWKEDRKIYRINNSLEFISGKTELIKENSENDYNKDAQQDYEENEEIDTNDEQ